MSKYLYNAAYEADIEKVMYMLGELILFIVQVFFQISNYHYR